MPKSEHDMKNSTETGKQRRIKNLVKGEKTKFSKEQQPDPELKKQGWAKKRAGQQLLQAMLSLPFKGQANSQLKQMMAEYMGIPAEEITVEMMMNARQIEASIKGSNTNAYNSLMARAHGAPKQDVKLEGGISQTSALDVTKLPDEVLAQIVAARIKK